MSYRFSLRPSVCFLFFSPALLSVSSNLLAEFRAVPSQPHAQLLCSPHLCISLHPADSAAGELADALPARAPADLAAPDIFCGRCTLLCMRFSLFETMMTVKSLVLPSSLLFAFLAVLREPEFFYVICPIIAFLVV